MNDGVVLGIPVKLSLFPVLSLVLTASAGAGDVISVAASTKGTLFDQAGTAIAKVASNHGDLGSTLRNYASPNVYIPAIARGLVSTKGTAFWVTNRPPGSSRSLQAP